MTPDGVEVCDEAWFVSVVVSSTDVEVGVFVPITSAVVGIGNPVVGVPVVNEMFAPFARF